MPLLLTAVALSGCGESEQDRERRAFDAYKRKVETACRATIATIAERGAPANLQDLQRLAPQAILDAQELVRAIRDVDVPKGSARRVEPFLADVAAAGQDLNRMEGEIVGAPTDAVADAAGAFHVALVDVDYSGREAGIRCVGARHIAAYDTAFEGPVYVDKLARFQIAARRRLDRFSFAGADTRVELAATYERLYETVQQLRGRYDTLALDAPPYADKPADKYGDLLYDLEQACLRIAEELDDGQQPSPAYGAKVERRIKPLVRREPRVLRRLIKALRRGLPAPPDPTGEGPQPA